MCAFRYLNLILSEAIPAKRDISLLVPFARSSLEYPFLLFSRSKLFFDPVYLLFLSLLLVKLVDIDITINDVFHLLNHK